MASLKAVEIDGSAFRVASFPFLRRSSIVLFLVDIPREGAMCRVGAKSSTLGPYLAAV